LRLGDALHERVRRHQRPCVLLRAGLGGVLALLLDTAGKSGEVYGGPGFRGERQHGGAVAQGGAVIGAPALLGVIARVEVSQCGAEGGLGAAFVAVEGEGGADLRLGERGGKGLQLGLRIIAQVADGGATVGGQHVERVGDRLAAGFEVAEIGEAVLEIGDGEIEALRGTSKPRLRARERKSVT
jgi:hypothetical protein